jgi:hypothetical protein
MCSLAKRYKCETKNLSKVYSWVWEFLSSYRKAEDLNNCSLQKTEYIKGISEPSEIFYSDFLY